MFKKFIEGRITPIKTRKGAFKAQKLIKHQGSAAAYQILKQQISLKMGIDFGGGFGKACKAMSLVALGFGTTGIVKIGHKSKEEKGISQD